MQIAEKERCAPQKSRDHAGTGAWQGAQDAGLEMGEDGGKFVPTERGVIAIGARGGQVLHKAPRRLSVGGIDVVSL